jgi:acyl carrier protein
MRVESTGTESADPRLLGEIAELLRQVTDESGEWAAGITPNASLDGDLAMESIEIAALGGLLAERYRVDLAGYLAGLDLEALIGLTVADLTALVAAVPGPPRGSPGDAGGGARVPPGTGTWPGASGAGPR